MFTPRLAELMSQIIRPDDGDLSPEHAAYILKLDFPASVHERHDVLQAKAQEGTLTPEETSELDDLLAADAFLSIMQSKARVTLRQHNPAA
jgi:hypothetical protein